jgi:hypothetical protein
MGFLVPVFRVSFFDLFLFKPPAVRKGDLFFWCPHHDKSEVQGNLEPPL